MVAGSNAREKIPTGVAILHGGWIECLWEDTYGCNSVYMVAGLNAHEKIPMGITVLHSGWIECLWEDTYGCNSVYMMAGSNACEKIPMGVTVFHDGWIKCLREDTYGCNSVTWQLDQMLVRRYLWEAGLSIQCHTLHMPWRQNHGWDRVKVWILKWKITLKTYFHTIFIAFWKELES